MNTLPYQVLSTGEPTCAGTFPIFRPILLEAFHVEVPGEK